MPPFNQNPNETVKDVNEKDPVGLVNKLIKDIAKNINTQDGNQVRVALRKYIPMLTELEDSLNDDNEYASNDALNITIAEGLEEPLRNILKYCPKGLDIIAFEHWLDKNSSYFDGTRKGV